MQIILAPDSFKGSLTAGEASAAMARGVKKVFPEARAIEMPLSDGGEGLLPVLTGATGGSISSLVVTGPTGKPVESSWGLLGDKKTAVIEMAAASGLMLVDKNEMNPLHTTTFGTGELIKKALDYGCSRLIIGVGGSATNDGGSGMAEALGVKFFDKASDRLPSGGGSLEQLERIDITGLDQRLSAVEVIVACDVDNLLTGPDGAAHVYGPQKGASPEMVEVLDRSLKHYAEIIKKQLGKDIAAVPGSGAAGGLGAGLMVFLDARLSSGIELVMDTVDIDRHLPSTDLVITGEGNLDAQSVYGKVPVGVARRAGKYGIPVIALVGNVTAQRDRLYKEGLAAIFSITPGPVTLSESMENAEELLLLATTEVMNLFQVITGRKR